MTLEEYCKSLPKDELFTLAITLCEKALPIWTSYASLNKLTYTDTVVGMLHEVKSDLLDDTISYCQSNSFEKNQLNSLLNEFTDPIVALQDSDWELPSPVEKIFYAVYNLLCGIQKPITVFDESTLYVSANQAVNALDESGLMSFEQIRMIIYS
jgi:hypothetical protein